MMQDRFVVNGIMLAIVLLIFWNLSLAKRKGEIYVGFAKYIWNGSDAMRRWFIGGVIINVIWALAIIVAFVAQVVKWLAAAR